MQHLTYYLCIINALALTFMLLDKRQAKKHRRRISERTLLATAALGGSIGAWLGMLLFHHKTRHKKFVYGIPAIFLVQVLIYLAVV